MWLINPTEVIADYVWGNLNNPSFASTLTGVQKMLLVQLFI